LRGQLVVERRKMRATPLVELMRIAGKLGIAAPKP
jgi:hypothetical protein